MLSLNELALLDDISYNADDSEICIRNKNLKSLKAQKNSSQNSWQA